MPLTHLMIKMTQNTGPWFDWFSLLQIVYVTIVHLLSEFWAGSYQDLAELILAVQNGSYNTLVVLPFLFNIVVVFQVN